MGKLFCNHLPRYMEEYFIRKLSVVAMVLLALLYLTPFKALAQSQSVQLSANGINLFCDLPRDCAIMTQSDAPYAVATLMDDVQGTLMIKDDSVDGYTEMLNTIFNGRQRSHPKDTFLEEMPDIVTKSYTFKVRSIRYTDENGTPATALYAYCKLNYRYIYCITLRNEGDIPYEMLELYTSITVNSRPVEWLPGMLIAVSGCVITGFFFILNDVRKKYFRPHVTGVITGVQVYVRGGIISVSYRLENGNEVTGMEKMVPLVARRYTKKIGHQVEITYSPKRPKKIHILSYKEGYVLGLYFLCMAALGAYLMIFHL